MWLAPLPNWLVVFYSASFIAETYFFFMQRCALEVCRDNGIPEQDRLLMLPGWYGMSRLAIGGKWLAVVFVFLEGGTTWGFAAIAVPVVLTSIAPVPHRHFFPIFSSTLAARAGGPFEERYWALHEILGRAKSPPGVVGVGQWIKLLYFTGYFVALAWLAWSFFL